MQLWCNLGFQFTRWHFRMLTWFTTILLGVSDRLGKGRAGGPVFLTNTNTATKTAFYSQSGWIWLLINDPVLFTSFYSFTNTHHLGLHYYWPCPFPIGVRTLKLTSALPLILCWCVLKYTRLHWTSVTYANFISIKWADVMNQDAQYLCFIGRWK